MPTIYPSLLAAPSDNLEKEIQRLNDYCQGYHIDIMDGRFVANTTWEPHVVNALSSATNRRLWVQLMVEKPLEWIDQLALPEYSIVSVHIESTGEVRNLIKEIKKKGWLASVAINPDTSTDHVFPVLNDIHQVLVMSVKPGFSGQNFIPETLEKVDAFAGYRQTSGLDFKIGIDGGISHENIGLLSEKGVDDFVIGSALFDTPNPVRALEVFTELANNPRNVDVTKYHSRKKSDEKK